jgi:hypothetical protein
MVSVARRAAAQTTGHRGKTTAAQVEDLQGEFGVPFGPSPFRHARRSARGLAHVIRRERAALENKGGISSGCWTRTSDPAVNSRLLYQLS